MSGESTEITHGKNGSITYRKGKIQDHTCLKVRVIEEMHDMLLNPKNGIVNQVMMISHTQKEFAKILDKVDKNVDFIIVDIAELKGEKEGERKLEEKLKIKETLELTRKRDFNYRLLTFIGLILAAIGLYIGYFKPTHESMVEIKTEVKTTNEAIIPPGTRGQGYIPPAFRIDTTKKYNVK